MHDDLQQLLLAIKLRLPVLVGAEPQQVKQHVEKIEGLVGECLSTTRNLTQELSPPIIQHGELPDIAEWLCARFGENHGLKRCCRGVRRVSARPRTRPARFSSRPFASCCCNVVKHSGSMEARLGLSFDAGRLTIQVEDAGRGFDPKVIRARLQQPEGFGLFNIKERLEALGGRLEFNTTARGGRNVRADRPDGRGRRSRRRERPARPTDDDPASCPKTARCGDSIRLLVVDDHAAVREGFAGLLGSQPEFEVVGQAVDGEDAVEQAQIPAAGRDRHGPGHAEGGRD